MPTVQLNFIEFSKLRFFFLFLFRMLLFSSSSCLLSLSQYDLNTVKSGKQNTHECDLILLYRLSSTLFCYFIMVSLRPINFHTLILFRINSFFFFFIYNLFSCSEKFHLQIETEEEKKRDIKIGM